jgi:ABC-type multidrug transport system fused ATPase/permease subunit
LSIVAALAAGFVGNRILFPGAYEVGRELRRRLVSTVIEAPLSAVATRPRGEIAGVIDRDVAEVEAFLNGSLPGMATATGSSVVLVGATVAIDPVLGGTIVVATAILAIAQRTKLAIDARHAGLRRRLRGGQDERVVEFVQGIEVAKAYGMRGAAAERLDAALRDYRDDNLASVRRTIPMSAVVSAAGALVAGLLIAVGGLRFDADQLSASAFAAVIVLAAGAARSLLALGSSTGALPGVTSALVRIDGLLALPSRPRQAGTDAPTTFDIEFRDVHFGYDGEAVLRGVSFCAEQGTTTAIVGDSGAGKTTLLHLVAGLFEPDLGVITIGGADLADLTDEQRRSLLAIVPQDPWLPDGTVGEAIASGRSAPVGDAQIVEAAMAARCDSMIRSLPRGYDTLVGEGGRLLSGGQRQRIAIARAMIAATPIVCLDEATASLDAGNERELHDALAELGSGRTLLVVAHRASTIRRADRIVLVADGRVAEQGTHDELVGLDGAYAARWRGIEAIERGGLRS